MNYKLKKTLQAACAITVLLIIVALIRNLPSEGERSATNAPRPNKAAALKTSSAAPLMNPAVKPSLQEMTADDSAGADEYQKENPEKKAEIDGLERQIRELHQAKEKEQRELDTLLAAIDDAQGKPRLTADAEPKKESEIDVVRLLLAKAIHGKIDSLDASLQQKLQEYTSAVEEQDAEDASSAGSR